MTTGRINQVTCRKSESWERRDARTNRGPTREAPTESNISVLSKFLNFSQHTHNGASAVRQPTTLPVRQTNSCLSTFRKTREQSARTAKPDPEATPFFSSPHFSPVEDSREPRLATSPLEKTAAAAFQRAERGSRSRAPACCKSPTPRGRRTDRPPVPATPEQTRARDPRLKDSGDSPGAAQPDSAERGRRAPEQAGRDEAAGGRLDERRLLDTHDPSNTTFFTLCCSHFAEEDLLLRKILPKKWAGLC